MRWQRRYGRDGLRVIAVAYQLTEEAEACRFVPPLRGRLPAPFGTRDAKALFISGETWPVTVVIDRDCNVHERIEGILLSEEFGEKIKRCSGAACYARRVASWRSMPLAAYRIFLAVRSPTSPIIPSHLIAAAPECFCPALCEYEQTRPESAW
jgi:hypothetical protein